MVDIEYSENVKNLSDTVSVPYVMNRSVEEIKRNIQENGPLFDRLNRYLLRTDKTNIELAASFRDTFSEIELPFSFEFDYLTAQIDSLEVEELPTNIDDDLEEEEFSTLRSKQETNNLYFIQRLRKAICNKADINDRRIIMQGRSSELNSVMFKIATQLELSTEGIINKIIDLKFQGKLLEEICQFFKDEVNNPEITQNLDVDLLSNWIRRQSDKYPQLKNIIIPNDLRFAKLEQSEKEMYINHINSMLAKYMSYPEILKSLNDLGLDLTYDSLIKWIRRTEKKESQFKFPADWRTKILGKSAKERSYLTSDMFGSIDVILEENNFNVFAVVRFLKEMAVLPEDYCINGLHSIIERHADHFVRYYDHLQEQNQVKKEILELVSNEANHLKAKGIVLPSKRINFATFPFEVQSILTKMVKLGFKGKMIRNFLIDGGLYSEQTCPQRQVFENYIKRINLSEVEL